MAVDISPLENERESSSMPNDNRNEDVVSNDDQSDSYLLVTDSSVVRSAPSTELSPASVTPDSTPVKPDTRNLTEGIKESSAGLFEIENMDMLKQNKTSDQLTAAVFVEDDDGYEEEVIGDSEGDEIVEEYEEELVKDDYSEETVEEDMPLQDDLVVDNPVETMGEASIDKEIAKEHDSKKDLASVDPSTSNLTDRIIRTEPPLNPEKKTETKNTAETTSPSNADELEPELNTDRPLKVGPEPTLAPQPQHETVFPSEVDLSGDAIEASVGGAVWTTLTSNLETVHGDGEKAEPIPDYDTEMQLETEARKESPRQPCRRTTMSLMRRFQ